MDLSEVVMFFIPVAYLLIIAVALINPVSRAFLHCLWVSFNDLPLSRMYVEHDKKAGQWIARVTCIALITDEGESLFTRIFYGKPELQHLMRADKENKNV
jgi:hypothetical protein